MRGIPEPQSEFLAGIACEDWDGDWTVVRGAAECEFD